VRGDEFLVAFFGSVDRNKVIQTLFKAVQLVSASACNVHLVGGGRGSASKGVDQRAQSTSTYANETLAFPDQLGISDKVT
jgi:glycosyltransferase involved in cell wall biosynthesis